MKSLQNNSLKILFITSVLLITISESALGKKHPIGVDHLLVADENYIWTVGSNHVYELIRTESNHIRGLAYNCKSKTTYWSDEHSRNIYMYENAIGVQKVVIPKQGNWTPVDIAVDSVANKLYVANNAIDTIEVFDLKNINNHAIVISRNIIDVQAIELDLEEGYLFVVDNYEIFRTELDGSNRRLIYSTVERVKKDRRPSDASRNFYFDLHHKIEAAEDKYDRTLDISDITIDPIAKRIYWIDTITWGVTSVDYNGMNEKAYFEPIGPISGLLNYERPISITYMKSSLYWFDHTEKTIVKGDLLKGSKIKVGNEKTTKSVIMKWADHDCSYKTTRNNDPCAHDNGGCDQLCFWSRSNGKSFTCGCNIGYELRDGFHCPPIEAFLFFTQKNFLRTHSLKSLSSQLSVDAINPSLAYIPPYSKVIMDSDKTIYYKTIQDTVLYKIDTKNKQSGVYFNSSYLHGVVYFALDWTTKNLYFFKRNKEKKLNLIVANMKNLQVRKTLCDTTGFIEGIVIYPNFGYLFFATHNPTLRTNQITRLNLDGSNPFYIVPARYVNNLAIDYNDKRLYWTEERIFICSTDLNGIDKQTMKMSYQLSSMIIHGSYIYATTNLNKDIIKITKPNAKVTDVTEFIDQIESISPASIHSLKLYDFTHQSTPSNYLCTNEQSNCEVFSFPAPKTNEFDDIESCVCGCPDGKKLAEDNKFCIDES